MPPALGAWICFVSDLNLSDAMCVLAGARSNKIWLVRNTGSDKGPTGTQIADNGGFHHSFQKSFSVPAAVPEEVVEVSAETKAAEDSGGYVQAGGCPAAIGCNGHFKNHSKCKPQYGAHFVSDLNLPDAMCLVDGAPFDKIWLARNTGSDRWPTRTRIAYKGKLHHSSQESFSVPAAPEEEVSAKTVAPEDSVQVWRFLGPDGHRLLQAISENQVKLMTLTRSIASS
ncbi:hypothetical protein PSTG_13370 [Puccinia striiformis f. sp. tritici PST-78]|uniref:Nbr1 FW domain-containing protein n=1 Tax=Puccinia striiformis f. sp. tritici PST-78 TaxID=1165861 RepID=A0A0L0V1U9_9BASI|nr:hypothetical protein PSTG_13370 [Puccinia striiformis f. sp. tritici PST-78]